MSPGTEGAPPAVAVVVPVYGQAELLPALLSRLAAQTWRDFEVVLVDNAPAPDPAVDRAAAGQPGLRTRVLHCPEPGSYAARNAGAAAAAAPLLAFTDADCLPAPGWLAALVAAAQGEPSALLAGPVRVRPGPRPSAWEIFDVVRGIPQERYQRRGYAATANLAVPREVLLALGGFDAGRFSGGDAEFCRRAGAKGHPLRLVAGAVVDHPARASWAELAAKARRVKGGQVLAGSRGRRAAWVLRSLVPPVQEMAPWLRSAHPWRWRLLACGVRLALWAAEVAEIIRLLILRRPAERR